MKRIVFVLLFFSFSITCFPQGTTCKEDLLPRLGKNRLYGYSDLFGNWKVIPFYTRVFPYSGSVAVVQKGSKYGVLNCEGKVVLRPIYDEITTFVNGFSWFRKGDKWGLVNEKGETLLEPKYDEAEDVSRFSDFSWVKQGETWGLFDKESSGFIFEPQFNEVKKLSIKSALVRKEGKLGLVVYDLKGYSKEPQYTSVSKINGSALLVEKGGVFGLINGEGKDLLSVSYTSISRIHKYRLRLEKNGTSYLADAKGRLVVSRAFEEIKEYSGGAFGVKRNGKYGFVNYWGSLVIPCEYNHISGFKNKRAVVQRGDSSFLINPSNEVVSKKYTSIESIGLGKFLVRKNGAGIINEDGKEVLEVNNDSVYIHDLNPIKRVFVKNEFMFFDFRTNRKFGIGYDQAQAFKNLRSVVEQGGKSGVIDEEAKEVLPLDYDKIQVVGDIGFVVSKGGLFQFSKLDGEFVGEEYSYLEADSTWPIIVKEKNSFGLMDSKGQVFVSGYSVLNKIGKNYFEAKKSKKAGVLDKTGKEVLPMDYQGVSGFSERYFVVQQKGKWGYVDLRNKVMIDFQYDKAAKFENGKASVTIGNESFLVNKKGQKVD